MEKPVRVERRSLAQSKSNAQITASDQSILESRGSDSQIERVSLVQAKSAFDTQQAIFVDVRSAAALLQNHGFKRVNALLGGFDTWQSAHFPVEHAAK